MWLKKLFGARDSEAEFDPDEEPARVPTPAVHLRTGRQRAAAENTVTAPEELSLVQPEPKQTTGFDPYNSGTFKKRENAWEKVVRR
jgi:hypothetical protein